MIKLLKFKSFWFFTLLLILIIRNIINHNSVDPISEKAINKIKNIKIMLVSNLYYSE